MSINCQSVVLNYILSFYLDSWKSLSSGLKAEGHILVPVTPNLVDLIWEDRPNPPNNSIDHLPFDYTGNYSYHSLFSCLFLLYKICNTD